MVVEIRIIPAMLIQSRAAIKGTPKLLASKVNIGIFVVDHAPINKNTLNRELPFLSIMEAIGKAAYSGPAAAEPKRKLMRAPLIPEPEPVYFIIVLRSTHTSKRPNKTKMGGMTPNISFILLPIF